ncbi:tetratricopeptide repeat protein [Chryseobacterium sp. GP-SGM7]|uniref:tetratricopeptide repeat protein n=1 Tax=Chryseobacterium sp. GP-SGM7 TaxID=3411323 RepID=UPI003B92D5B8
MVKFLSFLALIFFSACFSAQIFFRSDHSLSDKKIIDEIARRYPDFKNKTTKDFSDFIDHYTRKNTLKNQKVKEIVTSVFAALKTAEKRDQLNFTTNHLFEKAIADSRSQKRIDLEIWASLHYAFYFYTYRKYEKSFPLFMFCIKNLDKTEDENIIQISETYKKIAYFLTTTDEFAKAEEYLKKAEKYAEPNSSELASILNTLGHCSAKTNKLSEAKNYFEQTLRIAEKSGDEVRYAKALGSLAEIEFRKKNYKKAISLLEKDIEISEKNENNQNTMYALTVLSKVYFEIGNLKTAEKYLEEAKHYSQSKSYFRSSEFGINEMILKIAEMKGDEKTELHARRRLEQLKDSLKDYDGKETILKVGWESQKKQLQLKVQMEQAKQEKESYMKIAAIVVCFLLILTIIFVIRSYRHKMKSKKSEYETKVLSLLVDKIKSENKLNTTHKTIHSYQIYLAEKNKQIEELEKEMEKVKNSSFSELEEKSGELQKLLESHLMTDENWKNFRNAFIQRYPEQYKELIGQHPDLTDSNMRIIILTKLNMNNTEISRLLGVTLDAVKKAKHRLRKKYENDYESLFKQIQ